MPNVAESPKPQTVYFIEEGVHFAKQENKARRIPFKTVLSTDAAVGLFQITDGELFGIPSRKNCLKGIADSCSQWFPTSSWEVRANEHDSLRRNGSFIDCRVDQKSDLHKLNETSRRGQKINADEREMNESKANLLGHPFVCMNHDYQCHGVRKVSVDVWITVFVVVKTWRIYNG